MEESEAAGLAAFTAISGSPYQSQDRLVAQQSAPMADDGGDLQVMRETRPNPGLSRKPCTLRYNQYVELADELRGRTLDEIETWCFFAEDYKGSSKERAYLHVE